MGDLSPITSKREHNVGVTPRRAFWEAFATLCLPSLVAWTIVAYLLKTKLSVPYAEAFPIYLFLAILPMPLALPVYRRYLSGTPRVAKAGSPRVHITLAILFAAVAVIYLVPLPGLLRNRKDYCDAAFHVASAALWLAMSVDHARRATTKRPQPATRLTNRV